MGIYGPISYQSPGYDSFIYYRSDILRMAVCSHYRNRDEHESDRVFGKSCSTLLFIVTDMRRFQHCQSINSSLLLAGDVRFGDSFCRFGRSQVTKDDNRMSQSSKFRLHPIGVEVVIGHGQFDVPELLSDGFRFQFPGQLSEPRVHRSRRRLVGGVRVDAVHTFAEGGFARLARFPSMARSVDDAEHRKHHVHATAVPRRIGDRGHFRAALLLPQNFALLKIARWRMDSRSVDRWQLHQFDRILHGRL